MKDFLKFFAVCVFIVLFAHCLVYIHENRKAAYEECMGSKIVLDEDTLIIVNYSFVGKSFTLSNGVEVSSEFVGKQLNRGL